LCPWIWRRNGIVTGICFWRDDDVFVLYFVLENNLKRERERERERERCAGFEQSCVEIPWLMI
jgi:hypothetical protein